MNELIFISIGSNCDVASRLRSFNARLMAFPFDWNLCSLCMIYNILKNDFDGFLSNIYIGDEIKRFYIDEKCSSSNEIIIPVICKRYNVMFPHDLKKNENIDNVKNKYMRRISRFREMINDTSKTIYLVHNNNTFGLNDWQKEVYCKYNKDILTDILDFNSNEYLLKIHSLFKHKPNINIIGLGEVKSIINKYTK